MSRIILGNIFGANGSVNFYMFHGGTNFGFMNGANILGYNGQHQQDILLGSLMTFAKHINI